MNNQFSIKVTTPCSENFNNFKATQKGGVCGSCKKEVIDFTRMNPQEITNYFQTKATHNTCGRFKNNQLTTYKSTLHNRSKFNLMSRVGIAFLTLFTFSTLQAQNLKKQDDATESNLSAVSQKIDNDKNIVIKGTVTHNGLPLPGADIFLKGSNVGVQTDLEGSFEFSEKLKRGDILIFSYLGYTTQEIAISSTNYNINVDLRVETVMLMCKGATNKVYKSKKD